MYCVQILPKVYYELTQLRNSMEVKKQELLIFDNAIEEIEKNYGDFLTSPDMFSSDI